MTGSSGALSSGTYRLEAAGELDMRTTPDIVDIALASRCVRDLVIDLSAVTFIDAAGVGGLLAVKSELSRTGRRLRVVGASSRVTRVLVLARAENLLERPQSPGQEILEQLAAAIVGAVCAAPRTVRRRACPPELSVTR